MSELSTHFHTEELVEQVPDSFTYLPPLSTRFICFPFLIWPRWTQPARQPFYLLFKVFTEENKKLAVL